MGIDPSGRVIDVKGPKGQLKWTCPGAMKVSKDQSVLKVEPVAAGVSAEPKTKALWGLVRSRVEALVQGVTGGFARTLEIQGVGYKARQEGQKIVFALGASHPISFTVPSGVTVAVDAKQTQMIVSGCDKELVGQVASALRALKPPEPYKGKGIRYSGEHIIRKAGKAAAAAGAGGAKK